jgi:hypothetical protein
MVPVITLSQHMPRKSLQLGAACDVTLGMTLTTLRENQFPSRHSQPCKSHFWFLWSYVAVIHKEDDWSIW